MSRKNGAGIAVVLALAVIAAAYAGLSTTKLDAASAATGISDTQVAGRDAKQDRAEAALRLQAKRRPPARTVAGRSAPAVQVTRHRGEVELEHGVEIEHEHGVEAEHHHGRHGHGGHGSDG
jgi:hypothetical protein